MNLFRSIWILIVLALVVAGDLPAQPRDSDPPAQLAVSPSRIELEIGSEPISQSVRLFNLSDREIEIKLSVATWDLDENNQVRVVAPTEQSLDQWMVINPLRFKVAGGASQTVRFMIRPRVKPEAGEHRAMIFFEEDRGDAPTDKVRVQFRIGVPIYGNVGEVKRAGTLHGVQVEAGAKTKVRTRFDITSTGTAHVRLDGQYAIWPAASFPGAQQTDRLSDLGKPEAVLPEVLLDAGVLPNLPVLAGDRRHLSFASPADLPPGDYVLDVNAELGDAPMDFAIPFRIDPAGEMTTAEYVPAGDDRLSP